MFVGGGATTMSPMTIIFPLIIDPMTGGAGGGFGRYTTVANADAAPPIVAIVATSRQPYRGRRCGAYASVVGAPRSSGTYAMHSGPAELQMRRCASSARMAERLCTCFWQCVQKRGTCVVQRR